MCLKEIIGRPSERRRFWLGGMLLALCCWTASAQEALRNMESGIAATKSRDLQMQRADYTIKSGDFRLLAVPSLAASWNDNVNLSKNDPQEDVIIQPAVGIHSSYQLTQRNLLYVDLTMGYNRYLIHPSLSTFDLNSTTGTGLSFEMGIKDVTLNLHDWMKYTQDASQNPRVSNTADYGTFQNTAGLSADWNLNQAKISAGYDHQNVIATSSQFDEITHASEMFFLRPGLQVHPQVTVGLEATAAFTTYDQSTLNDNEAYTFGAFTEFHPSEFFQMTARGGYTMYQFQSTSSTIATSDQNSWYAALNLSHRPWESITYGVDLGHEMQLGTFSDLSEDWYFRPNITWNVIKDWSCGTTFFYEHGKQGVGNVSGNFTENYDWYGGVLTASHALTKSLTLTFSYRLTLRSSDQPNSGYAQNVVGFRLTYQPK